VRSKLATPHDENSKNEKGGTITGEQNNLARRAANVMANF